MIIETDLGHDSDDFLAITWLLAKGYKIDAILLHPGHPHQIAIAKFITKRLGLDIPVGVSGNLDNDVMPGSVHKYFLDKYKLPYKAKPDGLGKSFIRGGENFLVIGPVSNLGEFIQRNPGVEFGEATMQGGFIGYEQHNFPAPVLDKFVGKTFCDTYNLNGNHRGGKAFLEADFRARRMVGKNVCHTITLSHGVADLGEAKNAAGELFLEAVNFIFRQQPHKKIHDLVAAACHIFPQIGFWVKGDTVKMDKGWGTLVSDEGKSDILAHINHEEFWKVVKL